MRPCDPWLEWPLVSTIITIVITINIVIVAIINITIVITTSIIKNLPYYLYNLEEVLTTVSLVHSMIYYVPRLLLSINRTI